MGTMSISLVVWYMLFNNDGLLVTSKLCTYYSPVGSTEFACGFHVEIFHALH